ncbi:3-deoxy-D-manno-octulosonic acid transferase [Kamptonema cortianum]|nr:3-deoxy-D-manno-octulosonic acid transferase [Geitlerinema splendidum]MDK3156282.1 3-deoxy-D-manno-octulosonic acid transferase [Kamptonema cortianum]
MIWIYNILIWLAAPIWVPWMLIRARRRSESVNWKERSGEYRIQMRKGSARLWFHAVSVGEVVAALPILEEVRKLRPNAEIVLSVTTSSGHQTAREKAAHLFDHLVYFPIDVPRFTLGALVKVRPHVVAIMETELWMNFLWACKSVDANTMVVNGRISDRSFPRKMRVKFFYQSLLRMLDFAFVQTDLDAERLQHLGAREVAVLGNCKFDQAMDGTDADVGSWRSVLGLTDSDSVVVIGSTRGEMEEDFVIEALKDPRLARFKVIHAPRHLERVKDLADKVTKAFGSVALRSKGETGDYLIIDTYGELSQIYSVADLVVVGGGFDRLGGQNILQPLAHGKPVIHGPNMQNFRDASELAARSGATIVASTPLELAEAVSLLLTDPRKAQEMGKAARHLVMTNVGASRRYAERIVSLLPDQDS